MTQTNIQALHHQLGALLAAAPDLVGYDEQYNLPIAAAPPRYSKRNSGPAQGGASVTGRRVSPPYGPP